MNTNIFTNQQTKIASFIEDAILILNMITTSIAVITENLKKINISNIFYDISNVGVIFVVIIFMIIKRLIIKKSEKKIT